MGLHLHSAVELYQEKRLSGTPQNMKNLNKLEMS